MKNSEDEIVILHGFKLEKGNNMIDGYYNNDKSDKFAELFISKTDGSLQTFESQIDPDLNSLAVLKS